MPPPSARSRASDGNADPDRLDPRLRRTVRRGVRARAPPPADGTLRAAVALLHHRPARARGLEGSAREARVRGWDLLRAVRPVRRGVRVHPRDAAALLPRDLAPRRAEQDPRSARGPAL